MKSINILLQVCEWVPNAESVAVVGDFNDCNETSHVCTKDEIPALSEGKSPIPHNSVVKLLITTRDGQKLWRMSPWTKYIRRSDRGSEHGLPTQALEPRRWKLQVAIRTTRKA